MFAQVSKKALLAAACAASVGLGAQAAVVWTGGSGNVNVFDDANYDFSSSGLSAIDPAPATVGDDVTYTGVNITTDDNAAFNLFLLEDGFTLTLDGSSYTTPGSGGLNGIDDGGDVLSNVNIINGSSANLQYVAVGLAVTVDGTSSITIRGGGDGVNSQVEATSINLLTGGTITFATGGAELDEQIGEGDIFVNGNLVTAANRDTLLSVNGGTATALIPEPGSLALLGLGGLAMLRRRRA